MALDLQTRYSEPQRHYHTLQHISHMLHGYESCGASSGAIELAIWFHDCVYDPVRGGPWNERESIRVWERFVQSTGSDIMKELKSPVSTLIEATISHCIPEVIPDHLDASQVAIFLDLDMRILAESSEIYSKYSQDIREEYSHFPAEVYRAGRVKVLEQFLSRERIFLGPGTEDMEQRARTNIREEIERLV
ncbi:hypothetical protein FB45DRAFT_753964 [Roridomyces roridus]|uniref:HD domain-containing protein n=1 Tax=Roridomyces roridus TaxID=1738132 RepID=A0AAD7BHM1_9AGAR|nr:hypothetical protein FB45DRAFT_753964 [Roridomyces roridus]